MENIIDIINGNILIFYILGYVLTYIGAKIWEYNYEGVDNDWTNVGLRSIACLFFPLVVPLLLVIFLIDYVNRKYGKKIYGFLIKVKSKFNEPPWWL